MNDSTPTPDRPRDPTGASFDKVAEVFSAVSDATLENRETLLDQLCDQDKDLRRRVQAMLAADQSVDTLLDQSLIPDPTGLDIGEMVDNFKLLKELGRGGMGVVYLAEQLKPVRRKVALKVIKPGVDTREVIKRFEAERDALSLMNHPNIARVLDAGTTPQGRPFFVMEVVDGQPITHYCDEHKLSVRKRLELFVPVCHAIQHAHQKGIIHRDIKPSNVLVADYDGLPLAKVIDFGVAKAINQSMTEMTVATGLGQIIGTFDYMSPEQSRIGKMDVDSRSDIYSLGVLLYELLVGIPPFDKKRLRSVEWDEMLRIIREDDPPKPSARIAGLEKTEPGDKQTQLEMTKRYREVKGELDWILHKAMEKDRNRRYDTPNEFAADIQCYLSGEEVSACPPSRFYRFSKFAKRNKVAIATTAIVASSLVLGIIGTSWQASRASKAELAVQEASDFLAQDLIGGLAGPESQLSSELQPDPNLQMLIFLNRLLDRVEIRFDGQPQVKANLRAALAKSFNIIGRHEDASRLCREYWEFLDQTKGREHPDTIRVTRQLIRFYLDEDRLDEVDELIHEALANSRKILGEKDEVTLSLMGDLADLYHDQGLLDFAVETHLDCLRLKREVLAKDHIEYLVSESSLASVYESLQRFDEAEALHRHVLRANEMKQGEYRQLRVAASLNNLAKCCLARGRAENESTQFLEAVNLLERGLDIYPDTLEIKYNLAQAYLKLDRFDEAEPYLSEILERLQMLNGPEDLETLDTVNMLGWCYMKQGRLREAQFTLSQANSTLQRLAPREPLALQVMGNLAVVYREMGRIKDSFSLDEKLLKLSTETLGPKHHDTLAALTRLGLNDLDLGRDAEGRARLAQAFESANELTRADKIAGILAESYLAESTLESVKFDAEPDFSKCTLWTQRQIEYGKARLGQRSLPLGELLIQCGVRQLKMRSLKDAESSLLSGLDILQSQIPNGTSAIEAQSFLGEVYAKQGKFDKAELLLIDALERFGKEFKQQTNKDIALKIAVLDRLILLEDLRGKGGLRWQQEKLNTLSQATSRFTAEFGP